MMYFSSSFALGASVALMVATRAVASPTVISRELSFTGAVEGFTYPNGTQVMWSLDDPSAAPVTTHFSPEEIQAYHDQQNRDLTKRADSDCWGYQMDKVATDTAVSGLKGRAPFTLKATSGKTTWSGEVGTNLGNGKKVLVYACINRKDADNLKMDWKVTSANIDRGLNSMDVTCKIYEAGYARYCNTALPRVNFYIVGKVGSPTPICLA